MSIQLEFYRAFITVARSGTFTGAADAMGLTQSAVSQAVAQLESHLGTRLFVRTARGARLTEEGQVLLAHVGGLLEGVDAAEGYFKGLHGLETGSLRIGASDTLCRHLLLPRLQAFHERYPGVAVQVTNRTSGETLELLRQGRVDIGFVNLPLGGLERFRVTTVRRLHDCFVYGPAFAEALGGTIELARLRDFPMLMLESRSASRQHLDRCLEARGVQLPPQIELGSLDLLLDFAEMNLGVAAVTKEFIGQRSLSIVRLTEDLPARHVGMVSGPALSPAARVFYEMM